MIKTYLCVYTQIFVLAICRPTPGSTWCAMLTSSDKHQWSPDGLRWFKPRYIDVIHEVADMQVASGGSDADWPKHVIPGDERRRLCVWGSEGDNPQLLERVLGGCCAATKSDNTAETWKQPYLVEYAMPQSDGVEANPLTEVAGKPVRIDVVWCINWLLCLRF